MDAETEPVNPYRAPDVRVEDVLPEGDPRPNARRLSRLAASVLDGLLYGVPWLVYMIVSWPIDPTDPTVMGMAYLLAIPFLVVNSYFLWRDGQTLGKKALRIRILRLDGSRASLSRLLLLRLLAPGLIGAIPILGVFFSLADALFIFGSARRCIHDHMADTIVVQVQ